MRRGDYHLRYRAKALVRCRTRRPQRAPQHNIMQRLLTDLQNHPSAWPFARPINKEEVRSASDAYKPLLLSTSSIDRSRTTTT